jgi:hypothetical protein
MVEPVSAGLLAALLALKFSEGLGTQLGAATSAALGRLSESVRERLSELRERGRPGATEAEEALASLEAAPDSERQLTAATSALDRLLQQDAGFRREVEELLGTAVRQDPGLRGFQVQVGGQASVDKIVQIGDVHGDVTF